MKEDEKKKPALEATVFETECHEFDGRYYEYKVVTTVIFSIPITSVLN